MRASRGLDVTRFVLFLVIVVLTLLVLAFVSFAITSLMVSEWFISLPFWAKWLICALLVVWFRAGHAIAFFKKAWGRVFDTRPRAPTGEEMAR